MHRNTQTQPSSSHKYNEPFTLTQLQPHVLGFHFFHVLFFFLSRRWMDEWCASVWFACLPFLSFFLRDCVAVAFLCIQHTMAMYYIYPFYPFENESMDGFETFLKNLLFSSFSLLVFVAAAIIVVNIVHWTNQRQDEKKKKKKNSIRNMIYQDWMHTIISRDVFFFFCFSPPFRTLVSFHLLRCIHSDPLQWKNEFKICEREKNAAKKKKPLRIFIYILFRVRSNQRKMFTKQQNSMSRSKVGMS